MNKILFGPCHTSMQQLIEAGVKVQTIVTSPPYYGLRDYGVEGQIGLEKTPEEYIAKLVEVFRLARELLADDGTLWVNIGDSYASKPNGTLGMSKVDIPHVARRTAHARRSSQIPPGFKHKDLMGIPWMLAFALRADGWYLRQDIIWNKPNAMPESIKDRCTNSHEYIFLLSKSHKYYFDQDSIREPADTTGKQNSFARQANTCPMPGASMQHRSTRPDIEYSGTRNKRSVWSVNTKPFTGAHFAVFPSELIVPCILAGSREGDVVFDPFMGSGTTALVARQLGRQYLGCEINPEYKALQDERLGQQDLFGGAA